MHTSTIYQTDHTRSGPTLARYDGAESDEYLSDSDDYNDNESDLGSDAYNNCESNYESDNEEATCASTSIIKTPFVQERWDSPINVTYTLRQ
jgi:hypothetical protein